MKLDLIIPAYNESLVIRDTIKTVYGVLSSLPDTEWSIIVADNGSTDGTKEKALKDEFPNVSVLEVQGKGKGLAIRTAAISSSADVFGFIDADLSADPSSIPLFIEKIRSGEVDVVIGSRLLDTHTVHRGFWRTLTSKVFNLLRKGILGIDVVDSQCGLKFMNKKGVEVLRKCTEDTWFFDLEFLFLAQSKGLRILEVPVGWEEFRYEGRESKLNVLRDGISAIVAMFRIRAGMRRNTNNAT